VLLGRIDDMCRTRATVERDVIVQLVRNHDLRNAAEILEAMHE
jgi:hypothetical protein